MSRGYLHVCSAIAHTFKAYQFVFARPSPKRRLTGNMTRVALGSTAERAVLRGGG